MKRTLLILAVILIIGGLTASISYADPPRHGRGVKDHLPIGLLLNNPEFIEKLHLTPDQIAKLKDLHFEHQKKMIALRSNLQLRKLELMKLMDAEQLDKNLVRKKVKEVTAAKGDLALEKVEMKLSAGDVLTKEQIAELKKMKWEFKKKRMIKRMEREGPGMHEKRLRMHRYHPGWHDMSDEEIEKEIYIEEEE